MKVGKTIVSVGVLLFIAGWVTAFKSGQKPTPYRFAELKFFPEMPQAADNPVTEEGVRLGRYLFYDPILSANNTMSCANCHKQEHAFSDAPNALSLGIDGSLMSRNTLPLFNLAWYPALFWDGKAASLEEQVFHPVRAHNEMNLSWTAAVKRIKKSDFYISQFKAAFGNCEIDSVLIAKAIAQFERTLISNQSKYDKVLNGEAVFTQDEYEGFNLMNDQTKGNCLHCHTTDADVLGTTTSFSNNGLDSVMSPDGYKDKGKGAVTGRTSEYGLFKIPSLRNVAITAPYMHDGRFNTLEEVLDFYSEGINDCANIDSKMHFRHQGGAGLSGDEKRKVITFLKTMTDSAFITNPAYISPFENEGNN